MKQTFSEKTLAEVYSKLETGELSKPFVQSRQPVHVFYGGAHLFNARTPEKLGKIALKSMETSAPDFAEFARAMWLAGADSLPLFESAVQEIEFQLIENEKKVEKENFAAWLAWTVYNRTFEKLKREPVEDFRIDFEDGYGFRTDAEEDLHAVSASDELAQISGRQLVSGDRSFEEGSYILP